jgi:hypothetical protein
MLQSADSSATDPVMESREIMSVRELAFESPNPSYSCATPGKILSVTRAVHVTEERRVVTVTVSPFANALHRVF